MPAGRPRSKTITKSDWIKAVKKWERVVARISEYREERTVARLKKADKAMGVKCSFCARFFTASGQYGCESCPLSPKFCHVEDYDGESNDYFHKIERLVLDEDGANYVSLSTALTLAKRTLEKIRSLDPDKAPKFKVGDRVISLKKRAWVPRKGSLGTVSEISSDDVAVLWDNGEDWWVIEEDPWKYITKYVVPKEKKVIKKTEKKDFPRPKGKAPRCPICDAKCEWNSKTGLFYCPGGGRSAVINTPKPKAEKTQKPKKPKTPTVSKVECPVCENMVEQKSENQTNDGYYVCPVCLSEFLP